MEAMKLHPALTHLAPLIGTWKGRGHGSYPTIQSFDYRDEITFTQVGKPFLHYVQRTWIGSEPMHTETGYLRAPTPDVVEIVIAIPTGQCETGSGSCVVGPDGDIAIDTDAVVACTPTAKTVERLVRRIRCHADDLAYEMDMAAVGVPLTLHLRSTLTRAS